MAHLEDLVLYELAKFLVISTKDSGSMQTEIFIGEHARGVVYAVDVVGEQVQLEVDAMCDVHLLEVGAQLVIEAALGRAVLGVEVLQELCKADGA